MSAYKQFLASDIIITPFEVNKSFTFQGAAALTASNVSIDRFLGLNTSSLFSPITDPTTGQVSIQYQRLIYNSVKELYYSNYLSSSLGGTSSYGDLPNIGYIYPGSNTGGNVLVGPSSSTGRYFNYNQTNLTFPKYFPTASNATIGVISIPSRLFGNYIQPNSFIWKSSSFTITDDGEGNLVSGSTIYGNIFYYHGLAVITSGSSTNILNFVSSSAITCSFSSSLTIYETQYKCTIRSNEFNATLNPSAEVSGSIFSYSGSYFYQPKGGVPTNNTTGSYFSPYVTTVGLYDEDQNLLAIGKLAQPLPTSATTDTTILINIDR
jgi:hypothetical protein